MAEVPPGSLLARQIRSQGLLLWFATGLAVTLLTCPGSELRAPWVFPSQGAAAAVTSARGTAWQWALAAAPKAAQLGRTLQNAACPQASQSGGYHSTFKRWLTLCLQTNPLEHLSAPHIFP